ncbi:MAG: hypothetical protein ABIK09_14260 [Pseudomonadota bacterium]
MGRRNATTFKKRQREFAKKEKKETKLLIRKQRKEDLDPNDPNAGAPTDPDAGEIISLSAAAPTSGNNT